MADPQIEQIVRDLVGVTERVIKKITLDLTANLIDTTPVDTGWARANWVPRIGETFIDDAPPDTEDDQLAALPGRQAEQQAGVAAVAASYTLGQGPVFVSNNVPYIQVLNDGHSQQAPAGFVEAAIEKAVRVDLESIAT